jgi:murein DD-endopeptidase MepM/ murein hydrolase activator NlpD
MPIAEFHLLPLNPLVPSGPPVERKRPIQDPGTPVLTSKRFHLKKRHYIILVSRDESGTVRKIPVPLHYAYVFIAAAVIGAFTITGLAGSYSRMLIKTASFNQLRNDRDSLQRDYADLQKKEHEKDIQAASLSSLATQVSAIYGLTASKFGGPMSHMRLGHSAAAKAADAPLISDNDVNYYKSLHTFYELRNSALSAAPRPVDGISGFGSLTPVGGGGLLVSAPNLWPVLGPITSSFGQREDPITGNGEGEFHPGIDISAPIGTPVRATADGVVRSAQMVNGYGREVVLDNGRGLETCYGHMSGFAVMTGQTVVRGQVIGYVGMSGRTTGPHLHYEVRIRNTPVNPHKYLRATIATPSTSTGNEIAAGS